MAGRPIVRLANVKEIQRIYQEASNTLDTRPLIVLTMRACGCTYAEIGEVFGISKQMVQSIIQHAESDL